MSQPQPRRGRGRPRTGRIKKVVSMKKDEWALLDALRGGMARGVYLGLLLSRQKLNPFSDFVALQKQQKRPD